MSEKGTVDRILDLVEKHTEWFDRSLPMIASENLISPLARRLLTSDFHDRYAEGHPGRRYYQGLRYIDEVERIATDLARRLFRCRYADVRPISGTQVNLAALSAFAKPNSLITAVDTSDGGHISHAKFGAAGIRGLEVATYPWDGERMVIDVERSARLIRDRRPSLCVFGQSMFLFPTPLREVSQAAHEVGALVMYDGAHVMGLIAGGIFQDPLREGADFITGSTHKTLPGPQGAVALADWDPADIDRQGTAARKLDRAIFPGTVSSHHLHHLAAKAVAFAEALEFGARYARDIVRNSKALAQSLHELGVRVLGESRGFTESHQVVLDVREHGGGKWGAETLEKAGIITNMNMIPGDTSSLNPSGIRLGTQELTRLGMGPEEMKEVASLIHSVLVRKEPPEKVAERVRELRQGFRTIHYCFSEGTPAYKFWSLC